MLFFHLSAYVNNVDLRKGKSGLVRILKSGFRMVFYSLDLNKTSEGSFYNCLGLVKWQALFGQRLKESWDMNCLLMLSIKELMALFGSLGNFL